MDKPTVRAVHRISLPERHGEITPGHLDGIAVPFPTGATVVLEVGEGWWIRRTELERIAASLATVAYISITGQHSTRSGGHTDFGIISGLGPIAAALDELLCAPRLFESV